VGLVVSKVPASAEVHLWRIDTMSRRSLTLRPGRHVVVCFVLSVRSKAGAMVAVLGTDLGTSSSRGACLCGSETPRTQSHPAPRANC